MADTKEARTCEVSEYAAGVQAWERYKLRFEPWEFRIIECHHVFQGKDRHEEPWNELYVSRPFHDWAHRGWGAGAQVACLFALWHLDRFDYARARDCLGRPPFGLLSVRMGKGEFDSSPIVKTYLRTLLREHGLWGPPSRGCEPEVDR